MALKVVNLPCCNFKQSVHKKTLKEALILRVPQLILTINAYIKYNYRWCVNSEDLHVVPGVFINSVHYNLGVRLVLPYILSFTAKILDD